MLRDPLGSPRDMGSAMRRRKTGGETSGKRRFFHRSSDATAAQDAETALPEFEI